MKRRVLSAPDIQVAEQALAAAIGAGIAADDTALVAHSDIEMALIPDSQKESTPTDFIPAALRGAAGGGAVGLLGGLVAVAIPTMGVTLASAGLIALVGAAVGTWSGALAGSTVPSSVRRDYEQEIEAGRVLVVLESGDEAVLEDASRAAAAAGARELPDQERTLTA
ncbi:hypothetical protein [Pseudoxanthomonas mexicana]|uniref:hypothetical protein n=1 Tax=Pseudoxanthomonas mexicana TaxID=128785 RepID=UPI00398ACCA4